MDTKPHWLWIVILAGEYHLFWFERDGKCFDIQNWGRNRTRVRKVVEHSMDYHQLTKTTDIEELIPWGTLSQGQPKLLAVANGENTASGILDVGPQMIGFMLETPNRSTA